MSLALIALLLIFQSDNVFIPRDYLDTGRPWFNAPLRPIGPITLKEANAHIVRHAKAPLPVMSSGRGSLVIDPVIMRLSLTSTDAEIKEQLTKAEGAMLRELVVESHRRAIPARGKPLLAILARSPLESRKQYLGFVAEALVKIGGSEGRAAAATMRTHVQENVRMIALKHLATIDDPRAYDQLKRILESTKEEVLDNVCASYLIRHGYADDANAARRIMLKTDFLGFKSVIKTVARRNAVGTNQYILNLAQSRKGYHGLKTAMIKALEEADQTRHKAALRALLADSFALVRNAAAAALVRRRDRGALPLMNKAATMPDEQDSMNGTKRDRNAVMRDCIRKLESHSRGAGDDRAPAGQ